MAAYGYDQPREGFTDLTGGDEKGGLADPPQVVVGQPHQPPPAYYQPPVQQQPVVQQPMQMAPVTNTTVVINQQQPTGRMGPRVWSSGTCDCFDDCGTCLCGLFCTTCLVSRIASKLGESCCVGYCVPGGTIALRVKLRTLFNIQGTIMDDCCMAVWCHPCMLCQMDRELKFISRTTPIMM